MGLRQVRLDTVVGLVCAALIAIVLLFAMGAWTVNTHVGQLTGIWSQKQFESSRKRELLSTIRSVMGYGGMIHRFKNMVLRGDLTRLPELKRAFDEALAAVTLLRALAKNAEDVKDAEAMAAVISRYRSRVDLMVNLVRDGATPAEIDKQVQVDDRPALQALDHQHRQFHSNGGMGNLSRIEILTHLRTAMGYGGMIHHFKNLVLRGPGRGYDRLAREAIGRALHHLDTYVALNPGKEEMAALTVVRRTLKRYQTMIPVVLKMRAANRDVADIDRRVRVNDRPALAALRMLNGIIMARTQLQITRAGQSLRDLHDLVSTMPWLIGGLMSLILGLVIWFMRWRIAVPVRRLAEALDCLAAGGELTTLPVGSGINELGRMARAVQAFQRSLAALGKAEAKARESEERLSLALRGTRTCIWDWVPDTGKVQFSASLKEVLGLNIDGLEQNAGQLLAVLHPESRPVYEEAVHSQLLKGKGDMVVECRVRHADGHYLWVKIEGRAMRGMDGRVVRALGKISDIDRQKTIELELRETRDNLEKLVRQRTRELEESSYRLISAINVLDQGFIFFDAAGKVVIANEKIASFYPQAYDYIYPGSELTEVLRHSICGLDEEALARMTDDVVHARPGGDVALPDGRILRVSRFRTPCGGVISLQTDITAFREQEEKLRAQAEKLEAALEKEKQLNEMQAQFVAMTSHEFRTPLAIIDSSSQRLLRQKDRLTPEIVEKRVKRMRGAVERMTVLMDSTLSAARMDAGKITVSPAPAPVRSIVEKVQRRHSEITTRHVLRCDVSGLPESAIVDAGALDQMLTNLVSNAIKYSPDGGLIDIRGFVEGASLVITVRDHGLGIAREDLPNLFTRYFRGATATGLAGTGIGLNLVKMLADLHEGSVEVESEEGRGSIFTLRLPVDGPAGAVQAGAA